MFCLFSFVLCFVFCSVLFRFISFIVFRVFPVFSCFVVLICCATDVEIDLELLLG